MPKMTPLAQRFLVTSALTTLCIYFTITIFFKGNRHHLNASSVKHYTSNIFTSTRTKPAARPLKLGVQDVTSDAITPDGESLAYVTFLSGTTANASDPVLENDVYFVATRMLGYQLLYQPHTATRTKIPFIVLLTSDVMAAKRARLEADGAVTVEVDYVHTPIWLTGEQPQWKDVMTKLRAWQLAKIDRALFLDGDMILTGPLDAIFDAPGTGIVERMEPPANAKSVEDEVPERYCFATMSEARPFHEYPPSVANGGFKEPGYFNAGFFVFGPSQEMFEYYSSLLNRENSFDPRYIEQNLLNYAHRQEGRLPWQELDTKWNVRFPGITDWEGGAISLHDKWWRPDIDGSLMPHYEAVRWRMEGYFQARDKHFR